MSRPAPHAPQLRALLIVLALLLSPGHQAAAPLPVEGEDKKDDRLAAFPDREARCTNGSVMKLKILDEKLTLKTPYGKLVIPLAKVTRMECAPRLPEAISKRIAAAVARLGDEDPKKRDAAAADLAKLKGRAYPALLKAEKDADAEVQRRAKDLLERLRNELPEEDLEVRERDVVHTGDSQIAGQIEADALRAHTDQFGEVKLRLGDVRSIRLASAAEPEDGGKDGVLQAPLSMHDHRLNVGKTLKFRVTGATAGAVWGTDTYTLDSDLTTAAVHSGAVAAGKTAVITVKIHAAHAVFPASVRNGVISAPYAGPYPAFEIVKGRK